MHAYGKKFSVERHTIENVCQPQFSGSNPMPTEVPSLRFGKGRLYSSEAA